MRSAQVTSDGVDTLITLTFLDHNENSWMFVMPVEMAQRVGWDLMGEGSNFFSEMVIAYDEPENDDV
jgi:hypothetical protein